MNEPTMTPGNVVTIEKAGQKGSRSRARRTGSPASRPMIDKKPILDACCGARMMWFDKQNPLATFMDIREEEHTLCDGRRLEVKPDVVADFTDMPFPDDSFRLVVFDPPHMKKLGKNAWMAQKYGVLLPTWETDLKAGFDECMRVLEPYGVLIFKWNEAQIKVNDVIHLFGQKPLFGHPTAKHGKTMWICFMKTTKYEA